MLVARFMVYLAGASDLPAIDKKTRLTLNCFLPPFLNLLVSTLFLLTGTVFAAGTLSGTIVDASDSSTPVFPVQIHLADPLTGNWLEISTTNNEDGSWEIGGLTLGGVKVFFKADGAASSFIDELYDDVPCDEGFCDIQGLGLVYTVEEGVNTLGVDLTRGLQISGTITNESGQPVSGYYIDVFNNIGESICCGASTDESGSWSILVAGSGTYYARSAYGNAPGFLPEIWNDIPCDNCDPVANGTAIFVTVSDVGGIDFQLQQIELPTGTLAGSVFDASDGVSPVHPVIIDLVDPETGNWLDISVTNNPDGSWEISGLVPGDYKVFFNAVDTADQYSDELFDGVLCDNGACDLQILGAIYPVTEGINTLDIDLKKSILMSGTVRDESGSPVAGVGVEVFTSRGVQVGSEVISTDSGDWSIKLTDSGTYYVQSVNNGNGLTANIWNHVNCAGCEPTIAGDPIIANQTDITNIDFLLCESGELIFTGGFEPTQPHLIDCTKADSTVDFWDYWTREDVRTIDLWGDSDSEHRDIVATYAKVDGDRLVFRVDYFDLQAASVAPTYFGLDFKTGGVRNVVLNDQTLQLDIAWDLLLVADGTELKAYDSEFSELNIEFSDRVLDRHIDFISFGIPATLLSGWAGGNFTLQALTPFQASGTSADLSPVGDMKKSSGTGKLILPFMNAFVGATPYTISWWDGYDLEPELRPGDRRGLRYLVDAADKYDLKVAITDLRIDRLAGTEFLGILDRLRALSTRGVIELIMNINYGHFMSWWPDDVDRNAIMLNIAKRQAFDLPVSKIIYPYESIITASDIEVIKQTGLTAMWGLDQYNYWTGWIEDWSDPVAVKQALKLTRKIHRFNGLDVIFDPGDFILDERWGEPDWSSFSFYWLSRGDDQGLHRWLRRVVLDMAVDSDQEQFFVFGTDLPLTEWMFEDVADRNFKWLASHPWIEVVHFSDLLEKGWQVVDHGTLDLQPDELLSQHRKEDDGHYNAYIADHYYGGISDGHSPVIAKNAVIEPFYDYVPILRDGAQIPSGRIMGDDKTPGSVIYESLQNLRALPENEVSDLAWLAFNHVLGDITFHVAEKLHSTAKIRSNYVGQINKIVAAAHWAEAAANGELSPSTVVDALDLDLDGEDEYTISNNKVFAVLENDGGRVEFAFAYDAEFGPVQLVAPFSQSSFSWSSTNDPLVGEAEFSINSGGQDAAFAEDHDGGGFNYSLMTALLDSDSITFATDDDGVIKRFTLSGNQLTAEYWINGGPAVEPGFGFVTNMMGMFERNWDDNINEIILPDQEHGWKNHKGGYNSVILGESSLLNRISFKDSPAGLEMRQRDDSGSYPQGHWSLYPYSFVQTGSQTDPNHFTISVILKAESD